MQTVTNDFYKDYKEFDPNMEHIIGLSQVYTIIESIEISERTRSILYDIYNSLEKSYVNSFTLLDKIPENQEEIDLTVFEGSGFYEKIDDFWIYHKGGGSLEALSIKKKIGFPDIEYPGFGVEYPGRLGTFSSMTFLGVKLLWQCLHEFYTAFIILAYNIENNSEIKMASDILGQCIVPLGVISLPRLTSTIRGNIQNQSDSIKKKYGNLNPLAQAAKILMVVPSPIRGTDSYDIEGKWFETNNIFHRTMSQYHVKNHMFDQSPYWNEEQSRIRGRSIRSMHLSGFLYQPTSAHLQNFYTILNPSQFSFNTADLCDLLPMDKFDEKTIVCLIFNIINGWRIAESAGPSYTIYKIENSYSTIKSNAEAFFEAYLETKYDKTIVDLYLCLPFSTTLAVAQLSAKQSPSCIFLKNWRLMMSLFEENGKVEEFLDSISERIKNELTQLYLPAINLRPKKLIDMLSQYVREGVSDPILDEIIFLSQTIQDLPVTDYQKRQLFYYFNQSIEFLFRTMPNMKIDISHISNNIGNKKALCLIAMDLLSKYLNQFSDRETLFRFMKDYLEEIAHIKHPDFRNWILSCQNSRSIKKWIEDYKIYSSGLIKEPIDFLEDYLGFVFKRKIPVTLLSDGNFGGFLDTIHSKWEGEEIPIYRPYPIIKINDINETEETFNFNKSKFISLVSLFNQIGFDEDF